MKKKFDIKDQGEVKQIIIEPSVYQDKHLFEVLIDDEYIVLYQEGEEWKHNRDYEMSPELLEQIVEKVESIRNQN